MPTEFSDSLDTGLAQEPLTVTEAPLPTEDSSDKAALAIVLQDVQAAQDYLNSKTLPILWEEFDNLYRAFVKPQVWPGNPDKQRSNLGMPIILQSIEDVLPQIYLAFFADKQPFLLDPIGNTSADATRAAATIVCWAIKQSGFKEEIRKALKSALLYGFLVCKYGWERYTETKYVYSRPTQEPSVAGNVADASVPTVESDEIVKKSIQQEVFCPTFENISLRNILFDPQLDCQDIRKGGWVCLQLFAPASYLDQLRDTEGYKNIPTLDELRMLMVLAKAPATDDLIQTKQITWREFQAEKATLNDKADPLANPIEILEYHDLNTEKTYTVLRYAPDKGIMIQNGDSDENTGFLSSAFIDVPGSAYGFGIGFLGRSEQKFQTGVVNTYIDQLALLLNRPYQRIGAANGGTQSIYVAPGLVRNEQTELKPLEVADVSATAMAAIEASENRLSKRIGLNISDVPTQALRTGSGVQSFQAAISSKLDYFIDIFSNLVFIPALQSFLQMCKDNMKPSQINRILTEEQGKAFEGDIADVYNGQYKFDVLVSTKLAARKAAAQLIPIYTQLYSTAPVQDSLTAQRMKFDFGRFADLGLEIAGYPVQALVVPMSDADIQAQQQKEQAAAQAAQQQTAQQQAGKEALQDQKTDGQIANTLVRSVLKGAENNSALETKLGEVAGGNQ